MVFEPKIGPKSTQNEPILRFCFKKKWKYLSFDFFFQPKNTKKKKKREKFAGAEVFTVDPNVFMKARFGKKKYAKYENYVGNDEVGEEIRQYGRANPSKPIIIKDSLTGAMLYLKYGKDNARVQNFY